MLLCNLKCINYVLFHLQLEPHKSSSHSPSVGKSPTPSASTKDSRDHLNGVLEKSPIYVTSVPNLTSSEPAATRTSDSASVTGPSSPKTGRSRSSTPHRTSSPSPRHKGNKTPTSPIPLREAPTLSRDALSSSSRRHSSRKGSSSRKSSSSPKLINGHHRAKSSTPDAEIDGNKSGDELELTHDLNDTLDDTDDIDNDPPEEGNTTEDDIDDHNDLDDTCLSESGDSLPGTPEKTYGITSELAQRGLKEVLLDQPSALHSDAADKNTASAGRGRRDSSR